MAGLDEQFAGLEGEPIDVRCRNGLVFAASGTFGIHASAATADEALAGLAAKLAELRKFEAASGLEVASRIGRFAGSGGRRGWARRVGVPVLIGGIVAMQLGWALSIGLANGFGRIFNASWRDDLVASLEKQVLALGDPNRSLNAQDQERLVKAARALRARYGPVWDEFRSDQKAAPR